MAVVADFGLLAVVEEPVLEAFQTFFVGKQDLGFGERNAVAQLGAEKKGIEQDRDCCWSGGVSERERQRPQHPNVSTVDAAPTNRQSYDRPLFQMKTKV